MSYIRPVKNLFVVALSLLVIGCASIPVNKAISADDQTYIDEILSKLSLGMTKQEVAEIIKQPYSNEIMRMSWHPPHAGNRSRVQAYFYKNRLIKITWIKIIGMKFSVIYEKTADESAF